jgi:glycosyltransferase involved in cell wall biosynthesis
MPAGPQQPATTVEGPSAPPPSSGCVIHLIPSALLRGAQVSARALVDELGGPASGHFLVSMFEGDDEVPVDASVGLTGGAMASRGFRPTALWRLWRTLRHWKPALVVAYGGDAQKYAAVATRVPVVYYAIGTMPEAACRGPRGLFWRFLCWRAARVATVSEDVAEQFRTMLGVDARRLTVLWTGRDPNVYHPASPADEGPEAGARELDKDVEALFVGYLNTGKRPELFIEVVGTLRSRGLALRGRLVGDGPLYEALRPRAAAAGVEMLGRRDGAPEMRRADLLVFPSLPTGEGMAGVLIDAGLSGLPIVATNAPGVADVVAHGESGFVVAVDDRDGLVDAVASLVVDPDRRRAMGRAARARCQRFTIAASADRWRQLIDELSAGSRSGGGRRNGRHRPAADATP